ncbi:MAG: glyceraldehyde-3-phosphate dehydrogenase [Saprospiraceae bacterium]|nr:glyceraldehyde-3-phosphate dehydrogenase [Saprospiraceae bacterium]
MNDQHSFIRIESDQALESWHQEEKEALDLLQIIGELRYDKNIDLVFFRHDLYDCRPSQVLNLHLEARNYTKHPIPVHISLSMAHSIAMFPDLRPAKLDLGKLAFDYKDERKNFESIDDFIKDKLTNLFGQNDHDIKPRDVVLYGFGRIGRLLAKRIISQTGGGDQLRLKAIVIRPKMNDRYEEASKRMSLLARDSVHGNFGGVIEVSPDGNEININGNLVKLIFAKSPEDIDYAEYGIQNALLIDNTGVWRNKDALSVHLRPGVSQVCLTAPAPDISNIVYGANHEKLDIENEKIFCAASCTTNAIAPVIKILDQKFGIEKGHVETIHAFTNDQNLLDNFHKKPRRGYAAPLNMVLTSTGAAKAVAKVLPHLDGKLTGNAVRVPTPNVSLAIMGLYLKESTDRDSLNRTLQGAALFGEFVEQIDYSESTEYVSTQAVGMTSTSVIDAPSTKVSTDGKMVTVYAWYDNEFGYTCQVVRLCKHAAGVRRPCYY